MGTFIRKMADHAATIPGATAANKEVPGWRPQPHLMPGASSSPSPAPTAPWIAPATSATPQETVRQRRLKALATSGIVI